MADAKEFGELLSKAIRLIGVERNIKLSILQDEIGYALGRKGGSVVEYWRKGNIPPTDEDVETLARELVEWSRNTLTQEWLEGFLSCADYHSVQELAQELIPGSEAPDDPAPSPEIQNETISETDHSDTDTAQGMQSGNIFTPHQARLMAGGVIVFTAVCVIWLMQVKRRDENLSQATDIPNELTNIEMVSEVPPTQMPASSLCGESEIIEELPGEENLLRYQGVSVFDTENTPSGILDDSIRSLAIGPNGLLLGYHTQGSEATGSITYLEFDERKWYWANCGLDVLSENHIVNSIAVDGAGHFWAATDGGGVLMYDGIEWQTFSTTNSSIPDDRVYEIRIDQNGVIWAATWQGIARLDGEKWTSVYDSEDELSKNPTYSIAFDSANNVWIGHVLDGVSRYDPSSGKWILYQADQGTIGGNNIRGIVVRQPVGNELESVWFATDGGGVTRYQAGSWTVYGVRDGLPSDGVRTIAADYHGRIWVGTTKGTAYFDGVHWNTYHTLSTNAIAFMPGCDGVIHCADDHVWTATEESGLTHSRLPYAGAVVDVRRVCFIAENEDRECPDLEVSEFPSVITATYPIIMTGQETFYFEIEASLRGPHELNGSRDFLLYVGETDEGLFGSHYNVPIAQTISPGQVFVISLHDRRMTVPVLPVGTEMAQFVSPWRLWSYTRLAGPEIHIVFNVTREN